MDPNPGEQPTWEQLASRLTLLSEEVLDVAAEVTVLFVTNLRSGDLIDVGPTGIENVAQHYTRDQADTIIRSLQELGVSVRTFLSEAEFMRAVLDGDHLDERAHQVVFTTAEGGRRSGRRALIPAFCNLMGLACMNSGAHAASVGNHKMHASAVLEKAGVRVPQTWCLDEHGWFAGRRPPHGTRVIMKPTYEGMSIGVDEASVAHVGPGFTAVAKDRSARFGQPVVVQEFVTGEEVGVPLLRLDRTLALPPVSFRRANGDHYGTRPKTFADENLDHDTSMQLVDREGWQIDTIRSTAVHAYDALEMRGAGRIDMRIDADGRAWVFDTNISPPPLDGTSYATAMIGLGLGLREMLAVWLGACLADAGLLVRSPG